MAAGNKIRVGIIGLGKVGLIRKAIVSRRTDFDLRAVCDVKEPDTRDLAGSEYYKDYRDLLDSDVDAVFVATPNRYTPEIVIAALDRNKHVFCEKPPGRSVQDIRDIMAAEARNPGCVLKFGFNHRYHGAVMEAKRILDSGAFKKILWIRGIYGKSGGINFEKEWRSDPASAGGGILLDQGIHMLDLFRLFLGDFNEVKSFVNTLYWDIPLEDNAFVLLRNEKNQIAFLHSSSTQWKHTFLCEICCEEGYLTISGILSSTRSYGQGEKLIIAKKQFEDTARAVGNPPESTTLFDTDTSWELEIGEFAHCIRTRTPVVHGNSTDALKAMELVFSAYDGDRKPSVK